jgi:hypothetical protein
VVQVWLIFFRVWSMSIPLHWIRIRLIFSCECWCLI